MKKKSFPKDPGRRPPYQVADLPLPLPEAGEGRRRHRDLAAGVLLGLTGLSAAGALLVSSCTLCYAVTSEGAPVAYIQGAETYRQAVQRVEEQVSAILQTDYSYQDAQVRLTIAPKEEIQDPGQLADSLMDTVEQVQAAYVLKIDGVAAGACLGEEEVQTALRQVKEHYSGPATAAAYFGNEVEVVLDYLPSGTPIRTAGELAQQLLAGDAQTAFAPEGGQAESVPALKVYTEELETYTAELPPEEEEIADASLLVGERVSLRAGVPGKEERTDRVVYCCGEETKRENLSTIPVLAPVSAQTAVGTGQGTEGAKGRFLWPCMGTVTSGFGSRDIFGSTSFHRGADIAAAQGSDIVAAAGGTVIWAGEKGSYGNLVKVDHGNGYVTYYAHCSQLLVQAGDQVVQGQTIAQVGATGRATGPHCHFEVLWQEEPIDPLQCLP